jgi:hypothetical protein
MKRQLLCSGTIACSTLVLSSWVQSSASEPNQQDCKSSTTAESSSKQPFSWRCLNSSAMALSFPEPLLNLGWNRASHQLPKEIETVYGDALNQAQTLAQQNQFAEAMTQLSGIPKNSRYYAPAQQLQDNWSQELLQQAQTFYQKAKITQAIAVLNAIPAGSRAQQQTMELKQRWGQQATALNRAIAAQQAGDWQKVIQNIQLLEGSPIHQSVLVQSLIQNAMIKRYEPNKTLVQIATVNLPTIPQPSASSLF